MKRRYTTLLLTLFCLPAVPLVAQPSIGGGTCSSATLSGAYEFLLSGRQVTATGTTTKLFQAVGTANFDGLSKIVLTITANTVSSSQSFGTPLVYAGTYSMQSNCIGSISITTGDTASFTLESYNSGKTFAVIGSDSNFAYNGSGTLLPATCPTTLTGIHEFSGTGSTLSGATVTGVLDVAGVLAFDGQGNVTANWTQVSNLVTATVTAAGTYTVGATCAASATLTDSSSNKYAVSLVIDSTSPAFALAVTSPQLLFDGSGAATQVAVTPGCSASMLTGTYEINLSGRLAPAGVTTKLLSSDGSAVFDGQSKVTIALTAESLNGSPAFGTALVYTGTYSVQPNCQGAINLTAGDTAAFATVAYAIDATTMQAKAFTLVGTDATYAYSGGGTVQPAVCAVSTLSGEWLFSGTGNSLSGSSTSGILDLAGVLQFDGQGNVTGTWTQASNTTTAAVTVTGTYSVNAVCQGTIALTDTSNNKYSGGTTVFGAAGNNFELVMADAQLIFTGAGRAAFVNPGQAVDNGASFLADSTPAGSVFSIFGSDLATAVGQPTIVPLPTKILTTQVTVNGELAPLFYVQGTQINAQMPEDIKPGVATVIVTNGTSSSNAVAVMVPATGTPGIAVYGDNRAVVINQDGSLNSATSPAKVGDTLVAYFTGGGPVNAAGPLVSGARTPIGYSPLSASYTMTLGGVAATTVNYIGLTPGSIGLYQANFVVPQVTAGDHPLVITISGQASNNPLVAISK